MRRTYRLRNQEIVDSRHAFLAAHRDLDQLILVTCEPTGIIRYRGPWRLIAIAERVADEPIITGSLL